jgi:hypothetical protein
MIYHTLGKHANQGRIQDFKLGGGALKKLCRAEGDANIFGVFRVKNHNFTPKNQFFPIVEGGTNIFGVFRVKNHDFTPTNHIFSNFRGGTCRVRPTPLDPPLLTITLPMQCSDKSVMYTSLSLTSCLFLPNSHTFQVVVNYFASIVQSFSHFWIVFNYCLTCSCPEYVCNICSWMLSNHIKCEQIRH